MRKSIAIVALLSGLSLAACGSTRSERVLTGAAGGAVAGQVVAKDPLAGAAIGGVVGAVR